MISFLHPGFLYAALAVAAGIVALHFLVTEQPRTGVLPTVRFFPDLPARASTLTLRLSDRLLMALRVAIVLLIGAAFAQPRVHAGKRDVARIVVIDVSRDVGSMGELQDSALRFVRGAAAVVLFDSTAREVPRGSARDSLAAYSTRTDDRAHGAGVLASALIASLRAASRVREEADSLEIVVVSPLAGADANRAVLPIRERWPGRIRVVRVAADTSPVTPARAVRVEWADSVTPDTWASRSVVDTLGAIVAGQEVLIHPFARRWRLAAEPAGSRVIARWVDGEAAAVEYGEGSSCVRSLAFTLPVVGDAMLRPAFVRFSEALAHPCGTPAPAPVSESFAAALEGPGQLTAASAIAPPVTRMTPLVPWLLAAALLLALAELIVRRYYARKAATSPFASVQASAGSPPPSAESTPAAA